MCVKNRLIEYLKNEGISKAKFGRIIGVSSAYITSMRKSIDKDKLKIIALNFPNLNIDWLLYGDGRMLKSTSPPVVSGEGNRIPFYDDVTTIGGTHGEVADTGGVSAPAEYIDAGDWFRDATAAIRHYGDSMVEYPAGCILAIKEVRERQLLVWGKDYVVETGEYRITKRIQRGKSDGYIKAYSTNAATYPDGQPVHEPVDIAWSDIHRIFLVLGYVVKKGGGTIVYSSRNKAKPV